MASENPMELESLNDFDLNSWVDSYVDVPLEDEEALAIDKEANE